MKYIMMSMMLLTGASLNRYVHVPDTHRVISDYQHLTSKCHTGLSDAEVSSNAVKLDPAKIRLLNWNVYKGSRAAWKHDLSRFTEHADLILLQEAHLHDEFSMALEKLQHNWYMTAGFNLADRATGVLTASHVSPVSYCAYRHNEPLIFLPKTALVMEYPIDGQGQTLAVVNIHMINFTMGMVQYRKQIDRITEHLKKHEGPVIVSGDFNSWSGARKRAIAEMTKLLSLKPVVFRDDHRLKIFGNTVDHIYYRDLEVDIATTEHVMSSDHNPMYVEFRVI